MYAYFFIHFQGCEYDDKKVTKEKEYEYRVIAINDAGPSEPSVASKPIQAKPEKGQYIIIIVVEMVNKWLGSCWV